VELTTTLIRYPPDTPEKQKTLGAFFGGIGAPPRAAERVSGIVKGIKEFNSNIKTFGIVGVCPSLAP
jgi:hypothetical protein